MSALLTEAAAWREIARRGVECGYEDGLCNEVEWLLQPKIIPWRVYDTMIDRLTGYFVTYLGFQYVYERFDDAATEARVLAALWLAMDAESHTHGDDA